MKIVLASMAPFMGGAEVAFERLALRLRGLGQEVVAVLGTRAEMFDRLTAAGLRCLHAPMYFTDRWYWWRYWSARRNLRCLIRQERPDVVHSNDLQTHQIVSDAARGTGVPRVCHHRFTFDGRCLDWLNKFGAERHLYISHSLMEELTSRSERLRSSPRAVVYDGVPVPPAQSARDVAVARGSLGLPVDRVIVLFAGQVIEVKGVEDLLRAWTLLPPGSRGRAELLIAGEDAQTQGAYRRKMESLAQELGVAARFLGFRKDVQQLQLAADIGVAPSHVEPLGLVALEAMAQCKPVVGCAVGGIRETVRDAETGLLVPPRSPQLLAQALQRLLEDEGLRARMGAAGRRRCEEHFDLELHAANVLREYAHVAGRQRAATAGGGVPASGG
jgi:glycosyltransferase involved in cell wall biosynthesis